MTKKYEMRSASWKDYFELHVSSTQKQMAAHIRKFYAEKRSDEPGQLADTLGLCAPVASGPLPYAYVFLNEENLGVGVVAHECMHVAMARERFVNQFCMDYGPECGMNEERLLYLFTNIVRGVYETLYQNNHIKKGGWKS